MTESLEVLKQLVRKRDYFLSEGKCIVKGRTRICGDRCKLYAQKDDQGYLSFTYGGDGCMLMHASAHFFCEQMSHKSKENQKHIVEYMLYAWDKGASFPSFFSMFEEWRERRECIELPWLLYAGYKEE